MKLTVDESALIEFAKKVELASSHVLEGMHQSKRAGEGIEFHSSRPYSEGEDIRRVDWKRYAATDRYYIQKFEREEKSSWAILLDASESMSYGEKENYSRLFVACLLFLSKVWGDSWTLFPSFEASLEESFEALLQGQAGLKPNEFMEIPVKKNQNLVIVSDFFFEERRLKEMMNSWSDTFSEIHLIQVLDLRELTFDFSEVLRFEDLEGPSRLTLDARTARSAYLEELAKHQEVLKRCLQHPSQTFRRLLAKTNDIEKDVMEFFENL